MTLPAPNHVVFEFSGGGFQLNMIRRQSARRIMNDILTEIFGSAVTLDIVDKKKRLTAPEPQPNKRDKKQQALRHPCVADAMAVFQGDILDVTIAQ